MTSVKVPAGAISYRDALRRATSNNFGFALGRGDANNRLEPECWPALDPSFKITSEDRVFTIGSCFARNVERALMASGVRVPVGEDVAGLSSEFGTLMLNKYTPPSIFQEIEWVVGLNGRTALSHEDVGRFFFEVADGRVIDTHLHATKAESYDLAMARREAVARIFGHVRNCTVAIITLGYIEAWWDAETGLFLNIAPVRAMGKAAGRYHFVRLNYETCYDYVNKTIGLLKSIGIDRVLVTTSPVPLQRTFTEDDIIIANMQSKSTLRTVAGAICAETQGVDYFPSYESVMLTRKTYVWQDDLVHVSPDFVGQIMARVRKAYMDDAGSSVDIADFVAAATSQRHQDAVEIYRRIEDPSSIDNFSFHVAAAEMFASLGEGENARRHAMSPALNGRDVEHLLRCAFVLSNLKVDAGPIEAEALEVSTKDGKFTEVVNFFIATGREDRAIDMFPSVNLVAVTESTILRWADAAEMIGRLSDRDNLLKGYIASNPHAAGVGARLCELHITREEWEDVLVIANSLLASEADYILLCHKQLALRRLSRLEEAIECAEVIVREFPHIGDAHELRDFLLAQRTDVTQHSFQSQQQNDPLQNELAPGFLIRRLQSFWARIAS